MSSIDPIIKEIYLAYFEQHQWKTVGLPNDCALASALQNREQSRVDYDRVLNAGYTYNVLRKYDKHIMQLAFEFVKKYSTVPNI